MENKYKLMRDILGSEIYLNLENGKEYYMDYLKGEMVLNKPIDKK